MKRKIYTQLEAYESDDDSKRIKVGQVPGKDSAAAAIPLISVRDDKFAVNPAALDFLSTIEGPIAVIALAGKYRTGKSFFLNRVLLEKRGCFGVGGTINACTKGIWLWTEPIELAGKTVLVMDTEGLGAFSATDTHDSRIFALALLISSYFIYNSVGTIDESAINSLSLVANLSKHICVQGQKGGLKEESEGAIELELGEYFPDFLWLVRDFALKLEDGNRKSITSQQYLEAALADQGPEPERNRVRGLLRGYFSRRSCETLMRPCTDEDKLQKLDQLGDKELRREFLTQAKALRKRILAKAPPKTALGKPISGLLLGKLCESFVGAINSGAAPAIRDSWSLLAEVQANKAREAAIAFFHDSAPQLPLDPDLLLVNLDKLSVRAQALFAEQCLEADPLALDQLHVQLGKAIAQLQEQNFSLAERKISAWLGRLESEPCTHPKELETRFRAIQDQVQQELGHSVAIGNLWARLALLPSWSWFTRLSMETALRLDALHAQQADAQAQQMRLQAQLEDITLQLSAARDQQVQTATLLEQSKSEAIAEQSLRADQHQAELAVYRQLVQDAEQRAADLQACQSTDLSEVDRMQIVVQAQQLELADREQLISRLNADLAQAERRSSELETAEQERQTLEQRHSQVQNQHKRAEAELQALLQSSSQQEREQQQALDKLLKENAAALSEIRRSHEQDTQLSLRRLRECEADAAKQAQDHAQALAESSKAQRANAQALDRLEHEAQALRKELDDRAGQAQRAIDQLQTVRDRFSVELKETHEKYRGDGQRALDERTKLMQQVRELSTACAVKDVRLETLTTRQAQAQEALEQEKRKNDTSRTSWQSAEIKRAESQSFELKQSLADSQSRILALERQLKDQEREFAIAKIKLQMDYELQKSKVL